MAEKANKVITEEIIQKLEELANEIKFGNITLVFQDGKIIQIDKSEKIRLEKR